MLKKLLHRLVLAALLSTPLCTFADGPVDYWNTEIRILDDESVIITEELLVNFQRPHTSRGAMHALPATASMLRKNSAPLAYTALLGFLDSKSATLVIFEEKGGKRVRVEQEEFLPPGPHTFIFQYKVSGLLQKGKSGYSLSWPIAYAWDKGVRAFQVKIIAAPDVSLQKPLVGLIELVDGKRAFKDIKVKLEKNILTASGTPVRENASFILIATLQ